MKQKVRRIVNIAVAAVVFVMWIRMFFSGGGLLSSPGFTNLKYFTVQSNLLEAIACLAWLASRGRGKTDASQAADGTKRGGGVETFKFVACAAVMVTFCVVALFLGPLYGFRFMYTGSNLWFHLLVPLAALFEAVFLADVRYTRKDNLLAMLPALVYGTFYLINIGINGKGEWPDTNDWYGFLNWGLPVGLLIFAGIALISWLLGFALRKAAEGRLSSR